MNTLSVFAWDLVVAYQSVYPGVYWMKVESEHSCSKLQALPGVYQCPLSILVMSGCSVSQYYVCLLKDMRPCAVTGKQGVPIITVCTYTALPQQVGLGLKIDQRIYHFTCASAKSRAKLPNSS
jgi:hypothetical protein